jgi:hypothetical protein
MSLTATSTFTIDQRDATPAAWEGGQAARNRWTKTFTGELAGTSLLEAIMLGLEGGARAYVGLERFDCDLGGRKGTFVLTHTATNLGNEFTKAWSIVPGSGTGELAGISGTADITVSHAFVLTYGFDA